MKRLEKNLCCSQNYLNVIGKTVLEIFLFLDSDFVVGQKLVYVNWIVVDRVFVDMFVSLTFRFGVVGKSVFGTLVSRL